MSSVEAREAALWHRALQHDARAFTALFALHRDRVFRHAARTLESIADAEDVTAAAFLELWRLRGRVRVVDGSVLPWLLVTATNLARNRRRGLLRYRAALRTLPHSDMTVDPADVVERRARQGERARAVAAALGRLNSADASLAALTLLEGFPSVEAAAALGIAPGTARNRLVRIRRTLRVELAELAADHDATAVEERSP